MDHALTQLNISDLVVAELAKKFTLKSTIKSQLLVEDLKAGPLQIQSVTSGIADQIGLPGVIIDTCSTPEDYGLFTVGNLCDYVRVYIQANAGERYDPKSTENLPPVEISGEYGPAFIVEIVRNGNTIVPIFDKRRISGVRLASEDETRIIADIDGSCFEQVQLLSNEFKFSAIHQLSDDMYKVADHNPLSVALKRCESFGMNFLYRGYL